MKYTFHYGSILYSTQMLYGATLRVSKQDYMSNKEVCSSRQGMNV